MKRKVMIFTGYYIPGVKGGGPIQSIKNLVDNLSDFFDFYILTSDRDLGDKKPYENVKINAWNRLDTAKVYYIGKDKINFKNIRNIVNSINPETVYLNSFFSFNFSIIPIILNKYNLISPQKLVVAPRGEFSQGAMNLKKRKKNIYIKLIKILKTYKKNNLFWHVTSEYEKNDLEKIFNINNNIYICQNFTANYDNKNYENYINKETNKLKLVFISRISPKKNLEYAINVLNHIKNGEIVFEVYGPIEDEKYWDLCKKIISEKPDNIEIRYKGSLNHDNVVTTFQKYHFFFFPTKGENYGHVISESMISGTPVITSDQTPWRGLQKKFVGWDINLKDENQFSEVIQKALKMNQEEYNKISKSAFDYGKETARQKEKREKMRMILG